MIRIGLIQFPGSNCERETALAVKRVGMEPVEFLWNEPLAKLCDLDGYILVGGFSYEDRSRAGIIAALDPVMQEIKRQSETGKPILGICNGAQILVEAGLVPGIENDDLPMALSENKRILNGKLIGSGFYNAWVHMRLATNHQHNAFTRYLTANDLIHLPVAHAEGRFLMSAELLAKLEEKGLDLFQYCDEHGKVVDNFPVNPNGSVGNIAAISNQAGNVMAMMPHPERTTNGDPLFASMRDYIAESAKTLDPGKNVPLQGKMIKPEPFKPMPNSYLCLVKLIITDNQAHTVQNTLRRLGFPVKVRRFVHWEIETESSDDLEMLKKSGLLYSSRKEKEVFLANQNKENSLRFLVRAKEDLHGQKTLQTLTTHYAATQINSIKYGVVWEFESTEKNISEMMDSILSTHIIGNEYAHELYSLPC